MSTSDTGFAGREPTLVTIEPARGAVPAFTPWQNYLLQALTVLLFGGSVLLIWVYGYTFWTLLEAAVRAFGWPRGQSVIATVLLVLIRGNTAIDVADGWPLDAAVLLALAATWSTLYLLFDHIVLLGNRRAKRVLQEKATHLLGSMQEVPRYFVELRAVEKHLRLAADVGWIFLLPDRLIFVGEEQRVTIPRQQVRGEMRLKPSFGNLSATWLEVELVPPWGTLRLLGRDTAARLSDTRADTERLHKMLEGWLNAPSAGKAVRGGLY